MPQEIIADCNENYQLQTENRFHNANKNKPQKACIISARAEVVMVSLINLNLIKLLI